MNIWKKRALSMLMAMILPFSQAGMVVYGSPSEGGINIDISDNGLTNDDNEKDMEDDMNEGSGNDDANDPGNDDANGPGNDDANGPGNDDINGPGNDDANGPGNDDINGPGNDDADGPGNDDANGPGNDDADGPGNDDANGSGNDDANGPGNDDANGPGNDDANGPGNDDANGPGNDDANGPGNDDANGPGNDDANGPGNDDANGPGNDDADGPGNDDINDDDSITMVDESNTEWTEEELAKLSLVEQAALRQPQNTTRRARRDTDVVGDSPVLKTVRADQPFVIGSAERLEELAALVNSGATYGGNAFAEAQYKMVANIDLKNIASWTPIGTAVNPFNGTFDGNGYVISNMTISAGDTIGLFGIVHENGVIQNVGVENVTVTGEFSVGAIVGNNNGEIHNSYATGNVEVTESSVGGIVGENNGEIYNSYAAVDVKGNDTYVGGLVGSNGGEIYNSYATGSVEGTKDSVGGLVGWNRDSGTISGSYATGNVAGIDSVGGLVGTNDSTGPIENSAALNGFVNSHFNNYGAGKVIGNNNASGGIINCYGWAGMIVNNSLGNGENGIALNYTANGFDTNWNAILGDTSDWENTDAKSLPTLIDVGGPQSSQIPNYIQNGSTATGTVTYISNAAELESFAQSVNTGKSYHGETVVLTDNIDLSGISNWTPIGTSTNWHYFDGTFDGNGYVISNLTITGGNENAGLFGYVFEGVIKNVGLEVVNVEGGQNTGGLVGISWGKIENCYVHITGKVSGTEYVGGLVGYGVDIIDSYATGNVEGDTNYVGGLVGFHDSGEIRTSHATGNVTGAGGYSGGLVGWNENGSSITDSYATGNVTANGGGTAGGLVGNNKGTISNSYATGKVEADSAAGGLAGHNDNGEITDSYATGNVNGNDEVGGLVGYHEGVISRCYVTGAVTGGTLVGGIAGSNAGTIENSAALNSSVDGSLSAGKVYGFDAGGSANDCYSWTGMTVNTGNMTGGAGNDLDYGNGFDVDWDTIFGDTSAWTNTDGTKLPILSGPGGSQSPLIPDYMGSIIYINNVTDLENFKNNVNGGDNYIGKTVILTADIDLNGKSWAPIGTENASFNGTFDGDGHIISNMRIDHSGSDYAGLFAYVTSSGVIKNVGLENVNVTGNGYVGGIAGGNDGRIQNSYVTGTVTGSGFNIGGIAGWNLINGTITDSYAMANVTGGHYVGGVAGANLGSISSSYAAGAVSGGDYVGGVVGYHSGTVRSSAALNDSVQGNDGVGKVAGYGATENCFASSALQLNGTLNPDENVTEKDISEIAIDTGLFGSPWVVQDGYYPRMSYAPAVEIYNLAEQASYTVTIQIEIDGQLATAEQLAQLQDIHLKNQNQEISPSNIADGTIVFQNVPYGIYDFCQGDTVLLSNLTVDRDLNETGNYYSVTFDTKEGGTAVPSVALVPNGGTVAEPEVVENEGFAFLEWRKEGEDTAFDFTTQITEKTVLNAVWLGVNASPKSVNFGTVQEGYAQPGPQTVTLKNVGAVDLDLTFALEDTLL